MAFGNGAGILSALDALQDAGVATTTYQNVQDWSAIQQLLRNSGYVEVVNDAGVSRGWVKGFTDVVGQTTTKTASSLPSVVNNASGVYDLAASEYVVADAGVASASGTVGEAFTALVTSPKAAVITAVLSAIGFAGGFDVGQDLVDKIFFNDETFDWKTDSIGGKIMTWIDKNGNAYISADLAERIKDVLIDNGLLDEEWTFPENGTYTDLNVSPLPIAAGLTMINELGGQNDSFRPLLNQYNQDAREFNGVGYVRYSSYNSYLDNLYILVYEDVTRIRGTLQSPNQYNLLTGTDLQTLFDSATLWQRNIYYNRNSREISGDSGWQSAQVTNNGPTWESMISGGSSLLVGGFLALLIGSANPIIVPKQPGATYPTRGNTIAQDYPTWWNNRKKVYTPDEDDPNKWTDLLHVRIPTPDDDIQNQDDTQTQPETEEQLDEQAKTQEDVATDTGITDEPPTDDIGDTPAIVPPTSGAETGLVKLYNPSLNQLATFSQWLWSNNIFDNFSKLFQDPMQAIIGLNLLYATPHNGTDANIIVGNLDSSCPSKTIDQQYIDIDCGTVTISRYFNNVLDYIATKIEVYLPFVGIVPLEVGDIIGKDVNIKCTVDVLTGTCLYQIFVSTRLLYTFTGNCAIQLPLSSANYSSVITGMIGLIGGSVATAVSGGALAPLAIGGAANMAANLKHGVERSGNIGANAGAMGVKKPYIIITRNKPYNPTAYNKYYGYPSNTTVRLSSCVGSGYTRVKDIRLHDIYTYDGDSKVVATDSELALIESKLKGGIIL